MWLVVRLGALVGLWLASRTGFGSSPQSERISKLSWTNKTKLTWQLIRDERVPMWARGLMLLPAAYVASPIDLVPDFVPFLGRLDDGLVFGFVNSVMVRFGVPEAILEDHLSSLEA
jgi:uncharacterized membrane protein YkvA (DUF1232 family)